MMQAAGPLAQAFRPVDAMDFDHFTARLAPRYCNLRKATIYAGSNEIQRNIIAKATLGLSKAARRAGGDVRRDRGVVVGGPLTTSRESAATGIGVPKLGAGRAVFTGQERASRVPHDPPPTPPSVAARMNSPRQE